MVNKVLETIAGVNDAGQESRDGEMFFGGKDGLAVQVINETVIDGTYNTARI